MSNVTLTLSFIRSGSGGLIGIGSVKEGLLAHVHCPNAYCKLQETDFNQMYNVPLITRKFLRKMLVVYNHWTGPVDWTFFKLKITFVLSNET